MKDIYSCCYYLSEKSLINSGCNMNEDCSTHYDEVVTDYHTHADGETCYGEH